MGDYDNSWERLRDIMFENWTGFYLDMEPDELMTELARRLFEDRRKIAVMIYKYERLHRAAKDYYAHHGGSVIGINVAMRDALEACDGE